MTDTSLHDRLDLAEMIGARIGQDFNGECHLTEDEARQVIQALGRPEAAERIRALEEGLRPFAKFAEIADADGQLWTDQSSIAEVMGPAIRHTISYGALRHARSLLAQTTAPAILAEGPSE